jgi:hypothetical protein
VTTAFGATQATANSVALQPDGKIVAAGFTQTGSNRTFAVARYLGDTPIADPNQRFLNHVYLDLLGRLPDSGGLASWTGLLRQCVTRTQVVQMVEASPEYQSDEVQSL